VNCRCLPEASERLPVIRIRRKNEELLVEQTNHDFPGYRLNDCAIGLRRARAGSCTSASAVINPSPYSYPHAGAYSNADTCPNPHPNATANVHITSNTTTYSYADPAGFDR
jgi:hypothetical protein